LPEQTILNLFLETVKKNDYNVEIDKKVLAVILLPLFLQGMREP